MDWAFADFRDRMSRGAASMGWIRLSSERFAAHIETDGVVVINVHVPDQGSIKGTDFAIPYTDIVRSASLPADRATQIAVYCRSGLMSTIAARVLAAAGYCNVTELKGGMDAWCADGRPVLG